jgi:alpha-amylase/alpha-mannosidase (GH57 family)
LAILWHQHQPLYYQDPSTGVYAKPWVRLHAAKDYLDMAATLAAYPTVRATFNLTPSLLMQIEALAAGAKDLYQTMTEVVAAELSAEEKAFLRERFFDTNPRIIARFPRYQQLADSRSQSDQWQADDWRDLQVLFNLAWTDPDWLAEPPLADLVARGSGYTESDKLIVLQRHLEILKEVIPAHRALQDAGQIEITTTPYAHPILPLLVSFQLARVAAPELALPSQSMIAGQDAQAHVRRGVEMYQQAFGLMPLGMWPAEGAVAQEIVGMVSRAGLTWMASDEEVLAKSLGRAGFSRDANETVKDPVALYRPYYVNDGKNPPVAVLFRDKVLSDKVGFTYSGTPGDLAARDFVERIHAIGRALESAGSDGPRLVTVILDGENAWEHYENDGKSFLHSMYELLSEDESIVTITPSEYLARFPDQLSLESLWPGSWVTPDYKTWIGEDEENLAWDYLARTRATLVKYQRGDLKAPAEAVARATDLLYAAEGSDWFWWYGADQNSGDDESFDRQYRAILGEVFTTLGEEKPIWVDVPIIAQRPQEPEQGATALIRPDIDGRATPDEWLGAGRFVFEGGVMASGRDAIDALHYGFDGENLYLRADARTAWSELITGERLSLGFYLTRPGGGPANAFSRAGVSTLLGFGAQALAEVELSASGVGARLLSADGENGWLELAALPGAAVEGSVVELALPFTLLGQPDTGDRLSLRAVLSRDGADLTFFPADSPALIVVPDLGLSRTVLLVEDPEGDDRGPGSYTYPLDGVFPGQAYDLKSFEVAEDDASVLFKLTFYGSLNNAWGAPNGMGIHTIDIYIDQDGVPGSGERKLLPGRNAAVAEEDAWDVALWAEGWTPGIFLPGEQGPERADADMTVSADPAQRKVILRVSKTLLGAGVESWKYLAVVAGQEGYPSSGVWRIRDVNQVAEQWRFGGAPADTNHTRLIDVALPVSLDQKRLLSSYPASQETNMDLLGPDDFAQLPMLSAADNR